MMDERTESTVIDDENGIAWKKRRENIVVLSSLCPKNNTVFDEQSVLQFLELIKNYSASSDLSIEQSFLLNEIDRILASAAITQSPLSVQRTGLLKAIDSVEFPNVSISKLTNKIERGVYASVERQYVAESVQERTVSDQSSSSMHQGMLQYRLKDGKPQYVFNVDDGQKVYTANLVESIGDDVLDCVYIFRKSSEVDLRTVGRMQVSSSLTVCEDDSEIMETQFLLCLSNDRDEDLQTSNLCLKKNKMFLDKVKSVVLRSRNLYKCSSHSRIEPSMAVLEDRGSENMETAAIVVRDSLFKMADNGGWGLKFLKNPVNKSSTTMDVLIPAGKHGGPRTENRIPSSLIDRWKSGGHCDCGGWDSGCPLTILKPKLNFSDSSSVNSPECNSIDLFIQGSKQNLPIMKMVNIHDDLYYIQSQSTLSLLQSFGIVTSILHSRLSRLPTSLSTRK